MTFPDIDSRDYVTNQETSKPTNTPQEVWVVYYQGLSGDWIWSLPSFHEINAQELADVYASSGRPTNILKYKLEGSVPLKPQLVKKIVKKIRKVRKVRQVIE